jgi:hypothetical protein
MSILSGLKEGQPANKFARGKRKDSGKKWECLQRPEFGLTLVRTKCFVEGFAGADQRKIPFSSNNPAVASLNVRA